MLRSERELRGYEVDAKDGQIGKVHEFYFDDSDWTIRYLVANTGNWLDQRLVLLPPDTISRPDWGKRLFPVNLTRRQVEESPPTSADQPVSRQHENELYQYYGVPPYWLAADQFGGGVIPPVAVPVAEKGNGTEQDEDQEGDTHLRSTREVSGYGIKAADGEIGHVEDFIVEDDTWVIRYLVVDTRNWLPGKKVLVLPGAIERVVWAEQQVHIDMSRERIENCPEFDPKKPINRVYEERFYDFHGRPKYWV